MPSLGAIDTKVLTFDLEAAWDEDYSRDFVSTLDPGWTIFGPHRVHRRSDRGIASVSVTERAANSEYLSIHEIHDEYDRLTRWAYDQGATRYAGEVQRRKNEHTKLRTQFNTTHGAIVAHCRARGRDNPIDQVGAAIKGEVHYTIRYIGVPGDIKNYVDQQMQFPLRMPKFTFWVRNNFSYPIRFAWRVKVEHQWVTQGWKTVYPNDTGPFVSMNIGSAMYLTGRINDNATALLRRFDYPTTLFEIESQDFEYFDRSELLIGQLSPNIEVAPFWEFQPAAEPDIARVVAVGPIH